MAKDFIENQNSVFKKLGASNHTEKEREENDYYATEPKAVEMLCDLVELDKNIWECACGGGHVSEVLKKHGHNVKSTDLIDRGYGQGGVDFLECNEKFKGDIVTNPPYKFAQQFVEKALEVVEEGNKVCMFLKVQFLEGKARRKLFETTPPHFVYVASSRLSCAMDADFEKYKGRAMCYCWYIWEKGYKGDTIVRWFN